MTEEEITAAHHEAIERITHAYGAANTQWEEPIMTSPGHGQNTSSIAVIASNGVGLYIVIETGEER